MMRIQPSANTNVLMTTFFTLNLFNINDKFKVSVHVKPSILSSVTSKVGRRFQEYLGIQNKLGTVSVTLYTEHRTLKAQSLPLSFFAGMNNLIYFISYRHWPDLLFISFVKSTLHWFKDHLKLSKNNFQIHNNT